MVFDFLADRRRTKLRSQPFPANWRAIVDRNVRVFGYLSAEDQAELLGHIQVFLAEKHFEGCGGLELTDEIRVTVAAQACLLLLHRETDYYPKLITVLVYPTTYIAEGERHVEGGIWEEADAARLGHTQQRLGALVLAWDAVKEGGLDPTDGHNLVYHEFAHQLDFEDNLTDGTPALERRADYVSWAKVMKAEFERLREADDRGAHTLIDPYGATNPAEFFAVITEAFFEEPYVLRDHHPAVYAELRKFYRQDPATFVPRRGAKGHAERH